MRRFARLTAAVLTLSLISTAALASTEWASYRDEFVQPKYNGSVGALDWSSDLWKELNDDGNKASGAVHVDPEGNCVGSSCLHIYGTGSDFNAVGAKRQADTSVFSYFELCYEVRFDAYGPENDATLYVEKTVDGGESWHLLASHELYDGLKDHPIVGIGGPYETTTIKFTVSGFVDGEVFIDDVELKGELATEPTTTTTTSTTTTSSTTTTTVPTTTTSKPTPSTTTTVPPTTTTSQPTETTDSVVIVASVDPPTGPTGPPDGSGIRDTPKGLQVAFESGLFGAVGAVGTYFVSAGHVADFRIVAETIGASWIWLVLLGVLIAWAIVSGLDQNLKRSVRRKMASPGSASE